MWSDEKLWVEKQHPNKQNERYWEPWSQYLNWFKYQGRRGMMCWADIINSELMFHWFNDGTSINLDVHWEMMQTVMWPRISKFSRYKRYWFQQDAWGNTWYCCKDHGIADVEIWRRVHKPFHREAVASEKSRSISPGLQILVCWA